MVVAVIAQCKTQEQMDDDVYMIGKNIIFYREMGGWFKYLDRML